MEILIDGYNLLSAMGLMPRRRGPGGLEKARLALIGRLAGALRERAREVTVVFDGAGKTREDLDDALGGMTISFTRAGEEADDLIEALIREHSAPKQLIVVSDDNRLRRAATRRRAKAFKCADFLDWLDRPYAEKRPASTATDEKQGAMAGQDQDLWWATFKGLDQDPTLEDRSTKRWRKR